MKFITVFFASLFAVTLCVSFTKIKRIPSQISLKATPNVVIEGVFLNGNQMYLDQTLLKQNVLNLQYYLVPGDIFEVKMKKSEDGPSGINGMIQFMEGSEGAHRGFHTGQDWICNKKEPKKEASLQKGDEQGTWIWADDSLSDVACSFKIPCPEKETTNVFKNTNQVVDSSKPKEEKQSVIIPKVEETKKYPYFFCVETINTHDNVVYVAIRNEGNKLLCAASPGDKEKPCTTYFDKSMCEKAAKIKVNIDQQALCEKDEVCKKVIEKVNKDKTLVQEMKLSEKQNK